MKRLTKRLLILGLPTAAVALAVVAAVEPNHIVPGYIAGEPFHRWRPASFWREVLRSDGESGYVIHSTVEQLLWPSRSSIDVLTFCLRDPDPNVRWPAAAIVGKHQVADNLVSALKVAARDNDLEVRLSAIGSLERFGVNARAALPELVEQYHRDPKGRAGVFAERALWAVSPADARREGGWRTVTSKTWGFSADFPAAPEETDITKDSPWGPAVSRAFNAPHQADRCIVVVTDYPAEFARVTTEDQRLDAIAGSAASQFPDGKITHSRDVELPGHKGREFTVEVPDVGVIRNRVFSHGRRTYTIFVIYKPQFLVAPAAEHFLNSLRITPTAAP